MSNALSLQQNASSVPPDEAERRQALDPACSFIVQAPAGSGKTGLLIQRYLKLLACVEEPEEVVAITFTRKAAAEMRQRLVAALASAQKAPHSSGAQETGQESEHEKMTRTLAHAVLQRDAEARWHLAAHPARLRIQTFDSLCASLTRQMPVLSGFGGQPETVDDASDLYLEAARATLDLLDEGDAIASDVECLLEHLDNDIGRIEKLLVEMLALRDHWLRHIHVRERHELEAVLKNARRQALRRLHALWTSHPLAMQDELVALTRYAGSNLASAGGVSVEYERLSALDTLPGCEEQDVSCWCAISELLLTKGGDWRKQHTVREGFPPGALGAKAEKEIAKSWKDRALQLISRLAANDDDSLRQSLRDIRLLPPPAYTEGQWKILGSIIRLLPYAVAQLKLVFQLHDKVDFSEVAQAALRALGDPGAPTDLALALDYRIRHLLIDEFQDTSISQYDLVTKLTTGWEPGDGRSMFVVGDPMQSIYRFRQAEVGLFLRARATGFGNVTLSPVSLSANFRSQRGIVDWVNATFAIVMPQHENISAGSVRYSPSVAVRTALPDAAVSVHPFFNDDHGAEGAKVVEIVTRVQRDEDCSTTAILVRNRSHLAEILPRLKKAGLRFRAIEIEGLGRQPVVQDLLVLTRALMHPADRLAWLALLRAPWCGLTLADLHALVSAAPRQSDEASVSDIAQEREENAGIGPGTAWEWLQDENRIASVSADAYERLLRLRDVLKVCMANRNRQSLRATVEAAWLALGGPACLEDETGLEDASAYLDYLESHEEAGSIRSLAALEEGLAGLSALPDAKADDSLQIMTIHKAKGLEFDCVIVPGLGRSSRSDDKKLFMWMEHLRDEWPETEAEEEGESSGGNDLLLAPIQETGSQSDPIYAWMEKLDNEKECLEDGRLLYVAATRARKRLHLLGSTGVISSNEGGVELKPPPAKTLLSKIWPAVESFYREAAAKAAFSDPPSCGDNKEQEARDKPMIDQSLRRLISRWELPPAPRALQWKGGQPPLPIRGEVEYSWAGETARLVGNIVHKWLQRIAEDGLADWNAPRITELRDIFRRQLIECGAISTGKDDSDDAVKRVMAALTHAVSEPRGRWLLESQQEARSELHMTANIAGQYMNFVIDRTFRDAEGQRWVVDYKTSSHEGADVEGFLDREQERYRNQLDRYAALMQAAEGQPVRRGLYFPLLKGWREWGDET
ncbi:UvrD-helicase domain-containing protein [Nitrosospira multiformis]|uniref:DNA 3'-5' helicase n=1 Tax=Nitrosospira multiformis TaxID=1231 RepID=A0A1I7F3A1_9PROT|nr:UvrD-helicase domain-containing protein [Nitrosospira multiformis]SFU30671.1 ATP-dependent exoDNAse (exonuclease V) beta subunit (contains helicase and exonuclease domains) [Nitrosospira multiformis]